MRTSKNISNICYYTPDYLASLLGALRQADAIGPCYWVNHKGEEGDKDHTHIVFLGGCRTYDTDRLSGFFLPQYLPGGSKAGMTARWTATKSLDDWLLYAIHEPTYLMRKGQFKQISYRWSDVNCLEVDRDMLTADIASARDVLEQGADKVYRILRHCVANGMCWGDVLRAGVLPIGTLGNAYQVFDAMARGQFRDSPTGANSNPAD